MWKYGEDLTNTGAGTPATMAPEVMMGQEYCSKTDLWSIGMMTYEMLTNVNPIFEFHIHGNGPLNMKPTAQNIYKNFKTVIHNRI